jgi:acyl-CoA synthetase (AMP-forming)/AMP-acid ligase II
VRVTDLLERDVQLYADKPAVIMAEGTELTYGSLRARAMGVASALAAEGVQRGDRVVVMAANGLTPFDTYLGCAYLGAAAVPLSTRLTHAEVSYIVNDAAPHTAIADPQYVDRLSEAVPRDVRIWSTGTADYEAMLGTSPFAGIADQAQSQDTALIIYTSGTTGAPKGVCLSQNALAFNAVTMGLVQGLTSEDVFMSMTPLYHAATGTRVSSMLFDGLTHVVLPDFDVDDALKTIERYRVTTTIAVPTQLQRILDHPGRGDFDLSSLRLLVYGAAPTGLNLVRRAITELQCDLYQGYGLTEAVTNLTALGPGDHTVQSTDSRLSSAGRAVPGVTISIRNEGVEVPAGTVGEICVRSDKVMTGYWRNEAATSAALAKGWLHTGDLARMDDAGYITIVGRSKDMLISGGVNVYPSEIEAVLLRVDGVSEAAVVGQWDEEWGESPVAFVIARPNVDITESQLIDACRTVLASYKVPRFIRMVNDFPRTSTGKVRKVELRRQLAHSDRLVS